MKKLFSFAIYVMAALAMALAMGSCKKEKIETMNVGQNSVLYDDPGIHYGDLREPTNDSIAPMISSNLPVFPCEVLYVVNKEYEMVADGLSAKTTYHGVPILSYQQPEYVELRLIELYPDLAYVGIMEDSQNFYDSVSIIFNDYLNNIQGIEAPRWVAGIEGDKENLPYISDENEMEILEMTETERNTFIQYNNLAKMRDFATLNDIFKVGGKDRLLQESKVDWVTICCICAIATAFYCAYVYYRALMCQNMSISKTRLYYGENLPGGVIGDAFRHVSVSVLLRWYLSEFKAYLIMDIAWERILSPDNPPCDSQMDLHNNHVGRHGKYYDFRIGSEWEAWMINVKNFIDNPDQNGAYKNWDNSTSWWTAYWGRVATSGSKYIYYKNN